MEVTLHTSSNNLPESKELFPSFSRELAMHGTSSVVVVNSHIAPQQLLDKPLETGAIVPNRSIDLQTVVPQAADGSSDCLVEPSSFDLGDVHSEIDGDMISSKAFLDEHQANKSSCTALVEYKGRSVAQGTDSPPDPALFSTSLVTNFGIFQKQQINALDKNSTPAKGYSSDSTDLAKSPMPGFRQFHSAPSSPILPSLSASASSSKTADISLGGLELDKSTLYSRPSNQSLPQSLQLSQSVVSQKTSGRPPRIHNPRVLPTAANMNRSTKNKSFSGSIHNPSIEQLSSKIEAFAHDANVWLGKFDANSLDTEAEYKEFSSYLDTHQQAIVTEGLMNMKIAKSGADFVQEYMGHAKDIRCCRFESKLDEGGVVTAELPAIELPIGDFVGYINKRKEFFANFESPTTDSLMENQKAVFTLKGGQQIHVRRIALYATDVNILANEEMKKAFDFGSELISSMLPCGKDCLMQGVSFNFMFLVFFIGTWILPITTLLK